MSAPRPGVYAPPKSKPGILERVGNALIRADTLGGRFPSSGKIAGALWEVAGGKAVEDTLMGRASMGRKAEAALTIGTLPFLPMKGLSAGAIAFAKAGARPRPQLSELFGYVTEDALTFTHPRSIEGLEEAGNRFYRDLPDLPRSPKRFLPGRNYRVPPSEQRSLGIPEVLEEPRIAFLTTPRAHGVVMPPYHGHDLGLSALDRRGAFPSGLSITDVNRDWVRVYGMRGGAAQQDMVAEIGERNALRNALFPQGEFWPWRQPNYDEAWSNFYQMPLELSPEAARGWAKLPAVERSALHGFYTPEGTRRFGPELYKQRLDMLLRLLQAGLVPNR